VTNFRDSDEWLWVAIADVDYFKDYNDFYGHPKGGEEFAMIWFEEDAANAETKASQILQMIRDLNILHEKSSVASRVTVSIGVHITRCGLSNDTHSLYCLADKALYAAKSAGRDRYIIST
jgi:diguanylate cyclase (GGDEF)-like protein